MYDLDKKFFKLTLNTFRASIQNSPGLIPMFDALCERISAANQLNNVDLFELATEYEPLRYPGFIKKETKAEKSRRKVNSNQKDSPSSSAVNANQNTRQNASPKSDLKSEKSNEFNELKMILNNSNQKDLPSSSVVNANQNTRQNASPKSDLQSKKSNNNSYQNDHGSLTVVNSSPKIISNTYLEIFFFKFKTTLLGQLLV
jgi:hypothetical protein